MSLSMHNPPLHSDCASTSKPDFSFVRRNPVCFIVVLCVCGYNSEVRKQRFLGFRKPDFPQRNTEEPYGSASYLVEMWTGFSPSGMPGDVLDCWGDVCLHVLSVPQRRNSWASGFQRFRLGGVRQCHLLILCFSDTPG